MLHKEQQEKLVNPLSPLIKIFSEDIKQSHGGVN